MFTIVNSLIYIFPDHIFHTIPIESLYKTFETILIRFLIPFCGDFWAFPQGAKNLHLFCSASWVWIIFPDMRMTMRIGNIIALTAMGASHVMCVHFSRDGKVTKSKQFSQLCVCFWDAGMKKVQIRLRILFLSP